MTTTFVYDALDRVRTESHSDGSATISYVYDVDGNLTSRSDGSGLTSFIYDAANRPLTKTTPAGAFSYSWDPAGNLVSAGDPGPITTNYHYDIVNRLDQVTEPGPVEATRRNDVFAYDTAGRRTDTWYNTGTNVSYSGNTVIAPTSFATHAHAVYDADGQLIRATSTRASSNATIVSDLTYSYTVPSPTSCPGEPAGRVTDKRQSVTDVLASPNVTTTYCYDADGRLTSAATPGGATYAYAFNANTDRTSGPEGTHTYNSASQLTDAGYSYDPDGNLTSSPAFPMVGTTPGLVYNGLDQTTSLTPTGGSATAYSYAGGGQTERLAAGPTTSLSGLLGLTVETTAGGTTTYIRDSSGSLISERTPGGDYYYVYDGQGSVIALVDPSGTQRAAYTYDPYGDHATATAMNGVLPTNPWRWEASYLDTTGLYKLGARYYDPHLGRFTQLDPVVGGSCNGYDYACGDPINGNDVSGTKGGKQPPLPTEFESECNPLMNSNYDELTSGLCTAYRYAQQSGNTLKDFYYLGYNSLQNPVDVTRGTPASSVYLISCGKGASTSAAAGALGGAVGFAEGAATGCGIGVATTALQHAFPSHSDGIGKVGSAANNVSSVLTAGKNIAELAAKYFF
jgi:RHS repeat-associated protein